MLTRRSVEKGAGETSTEGPKHLQLPPLQDTPDITAASMQLAPQLPPQLPPLLDTPDTWQSGMYAITRFSHTFESPEIESEFLESHVYIIRLRFRSIILVVMRERECVCVREVSLDSSSS